jgi:hypothetical protein
MENPIRFKVQLVSPSLQKEKEKECFLTFHVESDTEKARLLETIVANPRQQYRITNTDESLRSGEWYEERN